MKDVLGEGLCSLSWFSRKLVPSFAQNTLIVACLFEFQLMRQNAFFLTTLEVWIALYKQVM